MIAEQSRPDPSTLTRIPGSARANGQMRPSLLYAKQTESIVISARSVLSENSGRFNPFLTQSPA